VCQMSQQASRGASVGVRNRARTAGGIPASRTAHEMTKAFKEISLLRKRPGPSVATLLIGF
jgi:hypothetical protein